MLNNRLKLNQAKTDFFFCCFILPPLQFLATSYSKSRWSWDSSSPSFRNLGVIFDYSMTMAEHITNLSRSINWQLRNLNCIRKFLILTHVTTSFALSFYSNLTTATLSFMSLTKNISTVFKLFKTNGPGIFQAFKAFHFSSPGYLSPYFQSRVRRTKWSLHSDLAVAFGVPRAKKQAGNRAFSVAGSYLGVGCRAVSVGSIMWTCSKTNLNLIFFLILPSALSTL